MNDWIQLTIVQHEIEAKNEENKKMKEDLDVKFKHIQSQTFQQTLSIIGTVSNFNDY